MRTTKKIVASFLAVCMLASTSALTGFAATADETLGANTVYSDADEALEKEYTYTKGDLGATYSKASTTFKVWSPTATEVTLNRYATGSDSEKGAANLGSTAMTKLMEGDKWTGVWTATVDGDIVNTYYTYTITSAHPVSGVLQTAETQDVYSVATGVNGKRSMVCDLDSTDPEGWENDTHILLDKSTDSYVWELHVKDFTWSETSGIKNEEYRGKFMGFTETGTKIPGTEISTCVDYLKQLGVTTVQLNPFYDFQSINEAGSDDQFNWGYDPQNYNVPEGSYSTNPYDGNVRINECKQMIQALHNAGIAVVMDVVYNHTYSCSKDDSCFQATVPDYYYRMNKDGSFSNGSGCGNEVATERAMARDYIVQSCLYWVNEYHVDGFRFDLMGLMDTETMNIIRAELDKVDERITTWGEGWTGGTSNYPKTTCTGETFKQATQANAKLVSDRMAFFNDAIRNGIKGTVFDINEKGFIAGNIDYAKNIRHGVRANSNATNGWLAAAPSQCVTYADCHDNATIYDQIIASTGLGSYGDRVDEAVKMNKLAGAIQFTSQGVLFNLAGQEMGRTKFGDTNSYKSSPEINMINWQNLVDYADLVTYYEGLSKIRKNFAPFTAADKRYDAAYIFNGNNMNNPGNQVAFTVENDTEGQWKKLAVIYNNSAKEVTVTLKDTSTTEWVIIANGQEAGVTKLSEVTGYKIPVDARSAVIAVDKASFEANPIESNDGKVVVNYVYKDGTKLAESVVLRGEIGTAYQTSPSASVPNTYVVDSINGETSGVYTKDTQTVEYVFTDYIPESLLKFGDINDDGSIDISDTTKLQQYLASKVELSEEKAAGVDFNYDGTVDITDVTMFQKYLAEVPVSSGSVVVNYYYYDADGAKQKLTDTVTITGRVGDDFTTDIYRVMGYQVDTENLPKVTEGKIPYGAPLAIDYYYVAGSLDVKLHVKHNGSLTWAPSLWIWGSDLNGVDKGNYSPDDSAKWPGVTLTDEDGDGWYDYGFTYKGAGTYNVIVSKSGSPQSQDYKGFVENEMWLVIDDSKIDSGNFVTFYTENPDINPNAPTATPLS